MYMTEWQMHWASNLPAEGKDNKRLQEWLRKGVEEGYIQYYEVLEPEKKPKEKIDGISKEKKVYPGSNVFERRGRKTSKTIRRGQ